MTRRRQRSVKIVATLGPSSDDVEAIERLHRAGADVFRINMSHSSHDDLARRIDMIREVEARNERPIGILMDLQGPKLRIGKFANDEIELKAGDRFRLDLSKEPGDQTRVELPHPEIFDVLETDAHILLDDGRIRLRVDARTHDHAETTVIYGGKLSNKKGVNLPDTILPVRAMTDKDRSDLDHGLALGIDWVALSFIQHPDDLADARKAMQGRAALMAKIEKPSALEHLDDILDLSDGLMAARGDLGVEVPIEEVPGWQKQMTRRARAAGKPVVVATQMLESMISSPTPTRAEVSDVATAVFEGADAVMLSAESAAGQYPEEAVSMMDRIARRVENDLNYRSIIDAQRPGPEATSADAITRAARQVAETLGVAAIVCYTNSGSTGLRAARERPGVPVLALSPVKAIVRRLALVWGLHCVLTEDAIDEDDMVHRACRLAFQEGAADRGDRVIITAGVPFGTPGATNLLRIAYVGDRRQLIID